MSVEGRNFTWNIHAGQDLNDLKPGTGHIFKAITHAGVIANNGREALGILLYGGKNRENVALGYLGVMKFAAAETVGLDDLMTVAEGGGLRPAKPGEWAVGRCLDRAIDKGAIGTGAFNFATPTVIPASGQK